MSRWTFVKGHYTATYAGIDIGTTRSGFLIRQRVHTEPITVDEAGDVPVDAINRGTEYAIEMRDFVEFAKVKQALGRSQGGASAGTAATTPFPLGAGLTQVGILQSQLTASLVLTPSSGANGPTYTASAAIVEGDVDIPIALGLKQGSLTFICYPDPTKSTNAEAIQIAESGTNTTN